MRVEGEVVMGLEAGWRINVYDVRVGSVNGVVYMDKSMKGKE